MNIKESIQQIERYHRVVDVQPKRLHPVPKNHTKNLIDDIERMVVGHKDMIELLRDNIEWLVVQDVPSDMEEAKQSELMRLREALRAQKSFKKRYGYCGKVKLSDSYIL